MSVELFLLLAAIIVGAYVAFNIGGNDLANSMGTSVGSKALTMRRAIWIASIASITGATLAGGHVTNTVSKGIIAPEMFATNPQDLLLGMFCVLLAGGIWIHLATFKGWPVSTTHSIIGALLGFGMIYGGFSIIKWSKIIQIFASWIISPVLGGIIGVIIYLIVDRRILGSMRPIRALLFYSPIMIFLVFFILVLSFIHKGLRNLHLSLPFSTSLLYAAIIGVVMALLGRFLISAFINKKRQNMTRREKLNVVEKVFALLQIMTAAYVAFAHGANDVANSIGPVAAILSIAQTGTVDATVSFPPWLLALGGLSIALGLATMGHRVIETVGHKVTDITPMRGFSAEFGAATTILICSRLGLPISTTHTLVGAVVGIGLARGMSALNFQIIRQIISSWLITLPFTATLCIIIYLGLSWILF